MTLYFPFVHGFPLTKKCVASRIIMLAKEKNRVRKIDEPESTTTPKPKSDNKISEAQAKRLFAISKNKKMPNEVLKSIVKEFGYEHSRDITRSDYEEIVGVVERWDKDTFDKIQKEFELTPE